MIKMKSVEWYIGQKVRGMKSLDPHFGKVLAAFGELMACECCATFVGC